ncbi:DNA polymerase subunit gamma-2, mitochondrial isoform X2 [Periplaneta americana]|uniref:DNA polymerase subunit gamma-2, mitochondrial isoform X2 n=1 Tax=Periplaneta americana TaxID=6978 RepID=UPI0037E86590
MTNLIQKVLQLCERQSFVRPVLSNKDSTLLVDYYKFGFAGELLKNNIHQEWLLSMVMNTDENIFPYHSNEAKSGNIIKAFPGRFSLTDIHNGQDGQLVEIKADFPWGSETVETIQYIGSKPFENIETTEKELFEVRDGRKKVIPHVIESTVTLESTVLTYLCDAYDEPLFLGVPRNVMRFHRKLAPYKASFSASASSASTGEELSQLSLYLTKQLRIAGVSTLLLPDVAKKSLEAQFARNDELGIPYTIVLNDATLKNGIIGLRSRDTTLKEQVHVTDLKSYMEQLLKNY